jgi:hypothetical protein
LFLFFSHSELDESGERLCLVLYDGKMSTGFEHRAERSERTFRNSEELKPTLGVRERDCSNIQARVEQAIWDPQTLVASNARKSDCARTGKASGPVRFGLIGA